MSDDIDAATRRKYSGWTETAKEAEAKKPVASKPVRQPRETKEDS